MNPNETIIVIRSLVPGGVAQQDGRLIPGDRLLFVNDINLENAALDEAVQALKGAGKGGVRIGVAKPHPVAPVEADADAADAAAADAADVTQDDDRLELQLEPSTDQSVAPQASDFLFFSLSFFSFPIFFFCFDWHRFRRFLFLSSFFPLVFRFLSSLSSHDTVGLNTFPKNTARNTSLGLSLRPTLHFTLHTSLDP